MDTFTWCGYEWIKQERWGKIHPDKPQWWYDESCSFLDDKEHLHLITKYNPKYFNEIYRIVVESYRFLQNLTYFH